MTADATTRRRLRTIATTVPAEQVDEVATRARLDAVELASDVRDVEPREVWGRLAAWNRADPTRLYAACVALAAMVPIDEPVSRLLAWTDHLEVA